MYVAPHWFFLVDRQVFFYYLTLFVSLFSIQCPAFSRALLAAASLTEDVSGVLGSFVKLGANLSASAARFAVVSGAWFGSLSSEMWDGVDITDTEVEVAQGRVIVDEFSSFRTFLLSAAGVSWIGISPNLRDRLVEAVERLSLYVPYVELQVRHLTY